MVLKILHSLPTWYLKEVKKQIRKICSIIKADCVKNWRRFWQGGEKWVLKFLWEFVAIVLHLCGSKQMLKLPA
jgi:hypothetical protein